MPVQGIDISKYQGDIDWRRVRDAGIRFAYLKVSEGGDHVDEPLLSRTGSGAAARRRCRAAPITSCTGAARRASRRSGSRRPCRRIPTQLPPVLDVEWNHASTTCPQQTTPRRRARQDPQDAGDHGIPHRQAAGDLHRHHLPSRRAGGAVSRATSSGCEASPPSRTSASATAPGPSGNTPRPAACRASAATSTATPSRARRATGSAGCASTASPSRRAASQRCRAAA